MWRRLQKQHSMEQIRAAFDSLRGKGKKALIPFVMGGDPDLQLSAQLLLALEDAGADLIEVGIPFSDPLADGPTVQAASERALARGATPRRVLDAIASVRHRLSVPVVCLSYWNPIAQFGHEGSPLKGRSRAKLNGEDPEAFLHAACMSGCSGLIVPDMPFEESGPLKFAAKRQGIATIFLAAPTSPPHRLRKVARASEGFIYYVSVTGTTGARLTLPTTLTSGVRQLRLLTTKPICVGFGISTPAQAASVRRIADGVIIGSALIRLIECERGRKNKIKAAGRFIRRMRRAV